MTILSLHKAQAPNGKFPIKFLILYHRFPNQNGTISMKTSLQGSGPPMGRIALVFTQFNHQNEFAGLWGADVQICMAFIVIELSK